MGQNMGQDMDRETLIEAARTAALRAYAPYSRFRVGAAVVIDTGEGTRVVTGANVENASYGLTLCAERAALAAAMHLVPAGERPLVRRVAVACIDAGENATEAERMPCGACRQWLAELAPHATYFVDGVDRDLTLGDLLPNAFRLEHNPSSSQL